MNVPNLTVLKVVGWLISVTSRTTTASLPRRVTRARQRVDAEQMPAWTALGDGRADGDAVASGLGEVTDPVGAAPPQAATSSTDAQSAARFISSLAALTAPAGLSY